MLRFTAQFNPTAFRAEIARALPTPLTEFLRVMKEIMIAGFYGPKSGRRGPVRQRSARGETPASQTKRLERSISSPAMSGPFTAQMIIAAPYAQFLNDPAALGRTFVEPSIEQARTRFRPLGAP